MSLSQQSSHSHHSRNSSTYSNIDNADDFLVTAADDDNIINEECDASSSSCSEGSCDLVDVEIERLDSQASLHLSGLLESSMPLDDEISAPSLPSRNYEKNNNSTSTFVSIGTTTSSSKRSSIAASQRRTVELIAPSTLPQGYQFTTIVVENPWRNPWNRTTLLVEVPPQPNNENGVVVEGQRFTAWVVATRHQSNVRTPQDDNNNHNSSKSSSIRMMAQPGHSIPYGQWRDGLFDALRNGLFHPVLCMACWCAPLLLAQVMTRLGLNVFGEQRVSNAMELMDQDPPLLDHDLEKQTAKKNRQSKASSSSSSSWTPFSAFILVGTLHFLFIETALSAVCMMHLHTARTARRQLPSSKGDAHPFVRAATWVYVLLAVRAVCRMAIFVYLVYAAYRTRRHIRARYAIIGAADAALSSSVLPTTKKTAASHHHYDCNIRENLDHDYSDHSDHSNSNSNHGDNDDDHDGYACRDCIVSVACHSCSIAQMARHTADYQLYNATWCCTSTGLSSYAPPSV